MGDPIIHKNNSKVTPSEKYYINEDGSVSKKMTQHGKESIASSQYVVNGDGSVTKRSSTSSRTTYKPRPVLSPVPRNTRKKVAHNIDVITVGAIIHALASIVFFIFFIINAYEPGETFGVWISILIGLGFISYLLYAIITRPISNWIDDLIN